MSDSDETLPPSDYDDRCDSPDLFDDAPRARHGMFLEESIF